MTSRIQRLQAILEGSGQQGRAGEPLQEEVSIRLRNATGPIIGQIVNFVATEGGGSVFAGTSITNKKGLAKEIWTLGTEGPQVLEARAVDQVTGVALILGEFTAEIGEPPIDPPIDPPVNPPAAGAADPTQLPAANGQRPVSGFAYGRSITAGQSYTDPTTNVRVLKVTDASTPNNNGGMDHGYSEGGPNISQPWIAGSKTWYTLKVGSRLVDLDYDAFTLTNWRNRPGWGEIGWAFSLNPATPRIAYFGDDDVVHRYNTATNVIEDTGNWPWTPEGGQYLEWIQTNVNDAWFVGMFNSNHTVVAFRPSDGFERKITEAQAGTSVDEPHIDRELGIVYLSQNEDDKTNTFVDLATGVVKVPIQATRQSDDHVSPVRGLMCGLGHWEYGKMYAYNPVSNVLTEFANANDVIGYPGDWHQAGQWVFGNGAGLGQWFLIDAWGSRVAEAKVQSGMISLVRPQPFGAHLVAAHDSVPSSYESQPQPTLAPDGKLVMWTSNQGGKGRTDVFVAKIPVKP